MDSVVAVQTKGFGLSFLAAVYSSIAAIRSGRSCNCPGVTLRQHLGRSRVAVATRMRATDRRTTRSRTRLRPRDPPSTAAWSEDPTRQARHANGWYRSTRKYPSTWSTASSRSVPRGRPMRHPRYSPTGPVPASPTRLATVSKNALRDELDQRRPVRRPGPHHPTLSCSTPTRPLWKCAELRSDASFDLVGDRDPVRDLGFRVLSAGRADCWADTLPDLRCDRAGCICCHDEASGFVASVASLWRPMPAVGRETAWRIIGWRARRR